MLFRLKKLLSILLALAFLFSCSFDKPAPTESTISGKTVPNTPKPINNAVSQPLVMNFNWTGDSTATYDLYLDTQNPPQILKIKDITSKPVFISGLDYSTTYYWKITARYSDGAKVDGPTWKFSTLDQSSSNPYTGNGYALFLDSIQTALPNLVNVVFQVQDLNGNGITDLKADNYEVYEDSQILSPSESNIQIKRKGAVPYTIKTVLMLDNSTSLKNEIDSIRNTAIKFTNSILPNQEVAIYQFSDTIEKLTDFTSDKNLLYSALTKYALGKESTNLYGAVKQGVANWNDDFSIDEIIQGSMIIFTDGKDTQGSSKLADAINAVHNKIVFSIGLGDEIQPEILNAIGTAGYYPITSINQLEAQFLVIQQRIIDYSNSFYILSYNSPKRGNLNHILTVRIKDNPHTGDNSFITGNFNSGGFVSAKIAAN